MNIEHVSLCYFYMQDSETINSGKAEDRARTNMYTKVACWLKYLISYRVRLFPNLQRANSVACYEQLYPVQNKLASGVT